MKAGWMTWAVIATVAMVAAGCGDNPDTDTDAMDVLSDVPYDAVDTAESDTAVPDAVDAGDTLMEDSQVDPDAQHNECWDPPSALTLESGNFKVVFDEVDATITLRGTASEAVFMTIPMRDLQIGTVPAIDPTLTYDPYSMLTKDLSYTPPAGLHWMGMIPEWCDGRQTVGPHEEGVLKFTATFMSDACGPGVEPDKCRKVEGTVRIAQSADGGFDFTLEVDQEQFKTVYFRIRPTVAETENFYGLGAYLDQVAHRGKIRAMQLELDFDLESGYNEAHVPVPLLISTAGWGVFVESWYPGAFDCAANDPTTVDIVFGTGDGSGEGFKFHLYAAYHPLDITGLYYKDTVDALLPARWGLGPLTWKDEVTGQAEVEADLHAIRDLDFATTAYWVDRPYASGVNAFDFHPTNYSDPQAMIDLAHDMGFRMSLWHTPYISDGKDGDKESSETTETLYQFAKDNNYLVKNVMQLNKWGTPIDFTNPDAYAWYQGLIRQYTNMGIEGFKLDYGEDIVVGLLGLDVQETQFFDGSTERTMHAKYQTLYHRIYAETLPEDGGFLLCRRGVWGDQANVSVIWPGDLDADFSTHRQPVTDGDGKQYNAVGGLPASVIYGLTLGVSGFPFFGSDTSGYRHSPPKKELYVRWMQQTALSSVMQVGNSSNTVPWELDSGVDLDVEFQDLYREFARLHLRLWPYEWTYAKNIAVTGHPIQRPIGLVWPSAGVHPSDEYMFGDSLLVAPVVEQGAVTRKVYFPRGAWMDWFNGQVFEGPATVTVDAPLDKLPLYIAESGIVPMLRPTIDALAPVADGYEIDTYADDPGMLYPVIFAGPSSEFTLFDGTHIYQNFSRGEELQLNLAAGTEFNQGALFDIRGMWAEINSATIDGETIEPSESMTDFPEFGPAWAFEFIEGIPHLFVRVPAGSHNIEFDIDYDIAE